MRRILLIVVSALVLSACPKAVPEGPPEQMIIDPATGMNITGEYAQSQLEEYYRGRGRIFEEARTRIQQGEKPERFGNELMDELTRLQESTDMVLKHIPNIGDVNTPEMFEKDRSTLLDILESSAGY